MNIETIKILYRENGTLGLWGIPYDMRPGQSPGDLKAAGNDKAWIYLGVYPEADLRYKAWVLSLGDIVPAYPGEWAYIK